MTSNLDDIISANSSGILKRLKEKFGKPTIISSESFDKKAYLTSVLSIIAEGIGAKIADVNEIRLVPRFGEELKTIDDGIFFSYDKLMKMMREIDPTLKDEKRLNEHPVFYEQGYCCYTSPLSVSYGIDEEDFFEAKTFKYARGPPFKLYREKKPITFCKNSEYMNKLIEEDIKEGKLKSLEGFIDLKAESYKTGKALTISIEEIKNSKEFWVDYCNIVVPLIGIDSTDNEEIILGSLVFAEFDNWDMELPSDKTFSMIQEFADAVGNVLSTAYLAHQWKIQNNTLKTTNNKLETALAELKDAQATIVEQEKMITEQSMAGGFAHEIRNALSPISTYIAILIGTSSKPGRVDSLEISEEDKKQLRERILKMKNQSEYALDITRMIMDYGKIESQKIYEETRIRSLLEEIVASHEEEFREKSIKFSKSLDYDGLLYSNPIQIRQVIDNLIINAEHAVEKTEKKEISLMLDYLNEPDSHYSRGNAVKISIYDTGCGIDNSIKDKIFRPFFTTRPDKKGAGLGLATSRRIARLYDGEIIFESQPGDTTFVFYLPIGSKQETEAKKDER